MRILAGKFRGRTILSPPPSSAARPITGLAKKSLFDTLAPWMEGATVADLYCGTGTIGLEALSRGARRCFFADRDPAVLERLRRNLCELGVQEASEVWPGSVEASLADRLAATDAPVDLAFVDPPFADTRRWDWGFATGRIFEPLARRLAEEGLVILRVSRDCDVPEPLGPLRARRTRRYGHTVIVLLGAEGKGA